MKPVFSTDNTLGRKNSVFHADKFAKGNLSESTEEKLCDAEMKKLDFRLEEKIPRKNKLINDFTLVAMFLLIGIIALIAATKGEEQLFKIFPVFMVGFAVGYGVMLWNKKCIRNLKPEENKSEEELEAERSYDSMVRVALDELMFPYDAKKIDTIDFSYKREEQLYDLSKLSCFTLPLRVYKKNNTIYITDLERKYEIPVSEGAYLERVNGKVKLLSIMPDMDPKDPKFNVEGVCIVDSNDVKCDSYGIYRFTHEGEEYGIYIASYDIPAFEEVINS